jgi:hypothetical protein
MTVSTTPQPDSRSGSSEHPPPPSEKKRRPKPQRSRRQSCSDEVRQVAEGSAMPTQNQPTRKRSKPNSVRRKPSETVTSTRAHTSFRATQTPASYRRVPEAALRGTRGQHVGQSVGEFPPIQGFPEHWRAGDVLVCASNSARVGAIGGREHRSGFLEFR